MLSAGLHHLEGFEKLVGPFVQAARNVLLLLLHEQKQISLVKCQYVALRILYMSLLQWLC